MGRAGSVPKNEEQQRQARMAGRGFQVSQKQPSQSMIVPDRLSHARPGAVSLSSIWLREKEKNGLPEETGAGGMRAAGANAELLQG